MRFHRSSTLTFSELFATWSNNRQLLSFCITLSTKGSFCFNSSRVRLLVFFANVILSGLPARTLPRASLTCEMAEKRRFMPSHSASFCVTNNDPFPARTIATRSLTVTWISLFSLPASSNSDVSVRTPITPSTSGSSCRSLLREVAVLIASQSKSGTGSSFPASAPFSSTPAESATSAAAASAFFFLRFSFRSLLRSFCASASSILVLVRNRLEERQM
mmetsp:Transcript_5048/g.9748  ORF Transcript_5048/g.9748 Transcript_5048/m.9748 type:complete len:218 (+) Transcript_5048:601-1254(+)